MHLAGPFDLAMYLYISEEMREDKRREMLHKYKAATFIENWGGYPYTHERLLAANPGLLFVHGSGEASPDDERLDNPPPVLPSWEEIEGEEKARVAGEAETAAKVERAAQEEALLAAEVEQERAHAAAVQAELDAAIALKRSVTLVSQSISQSVNESVSS